MFFAFFGSYVVDWVDVMGWLPGVFCAFFACFCALFYAFGGLLGETEGGAGHAVLARAAPACFG